MALALSLMMAMPMKAEHVTPETARKVAQAFFNNNHAKSSQLTDLSEEAGFSNLYIFNAEQGFVIIAADDCVKPILGYSLMGKFDPDSMPENLIWWLQGYNNQIQEVIDGQTKASYKVTKQWKDLESGVYSSAKARAEIGPLISTKWNQTYPYNYYCPSCSSGGNGGHVYTGCVATAMAQVLKYHNAPAQGIGSHTYTHATYGPQSANFGETQYDWDNMSEKIYSNSSQASITAVATLIYHCGVAVDMNYGTSSSGAYTIDIVPAFVNYFNYSQNARLIERSNYSDSLWIAIMRDELDNSRPILYGGMDHPTNPQSGHSFVCDGYGKDEYNDYYFSFNWGWSGNYDGYFSIDNMTPGHGQPGGGNHNYTYLQDAVVGIAPSDCQASAPVSLSYTANGRDITLSWDKVDNAISYYVYRNSTLIANVEADQSHTITYFDEKAPYGTNTYYVRSCDENDELSAPSNYVSVTITFPAPTHLLAQMQSNGVSLSWTGYEGSFGYNLYCNDVLIASNLPTTTFIDQRSVAGVLVYHVKSTDSFGDESEASNTSTVTVPYTTPVVSDLYATMSNGNIKLDWDIPKWCYPQQQTAILTYGNGNLYYAWSSVYYAHRYPATDLAIHADKVLYKVSTYAYYAGTYTTYIYTNTINDKPDPNALAATNTLVCNEGQTGWREITLSAPVFLSGNTDLWIVMKQENTGKDYPTLTFNLGTYNANACYSGMNSPTNLSPLAEQYKCAWFIRAYLTDGTYTYNLYDGTSSVASNIADTSYLIENITRNALHQYTVKTNFNGSETAPSNKASIAMGTHALNNLNLETDRMLVSENSILTVSGTLVSTNPDHLILEDGAQLINDSEGVKATVKRTISPFTEGHNDGWNLIASPVTENLDADDDVQGLTENEYDLYTFDPSGTDENGNAKEWRNYKADAFTDIEHKVGYLYANDEETTLSFVGTLAGTAANTELTLNAGTDFEGFNLIGNPYPCNVYTTKPFYVLQYNGEEDATSFVLGDNPIPPCTAILVQAQTNDKTVSFSKTPVTEPSAIVMRLSEQKLRSNTTLDEARISFEEQCQLTKFAWGKAASTIYIPQNGQNFAVAYANGQNEMPLNFKAAKNGTYTLGFEVKDLELDYLHLIDNMTGADVDLLATPSYSFEGKADDYESRFRLVFSNYEDADDDNVHFAYYVDGEIRIVSDACNASLQVVDMTGRVVVSRQGDAMNHVSTSGMTAGVYVLRLINGEKVMTQKMVIE